MQYLPSIFLGLLVLISLKGSPALAAPGDLDPTFGNKGKVYTNAGTDDRVRATAIQSDGKIVVAGTTIVRYNSNGTLDGTFGNGGILRDEFTFLQANDIAIQPDGKIVIAGTASSVFAVARYNADGTPDTTFSGDGWLITDFSVGDLVFLSSSANGVVIQPDGKIVAAGTLVLTDFTYYDAVASHVVLARYNTNGSLDTTFRHSGIVEDHLSPDFDFDRVDGIALQADGKLVVAGGTGTGVSVPYDILLARYNTDGHLDPAFDEDGIAFCDFDGSKEIASAITIQPNGKIVVGGWHGSPLEFGLARFNINGSLDAAFSGDGWVNTNFGYGYAEVYEVAIQSDGKIVAVGGTGAGEEFSGYTRVAVARYDSDGSLDTSFSGDGMIADQFGGGGVSWALAAAIQPDGRIVVAGTAVSDILVLRFQARSTPFDFDGDGRADIGVFRPEEGNWYVYGSTAGFMAGTWGLPTDGLVPADYDGDGKTDLAIVRDGIWWILKSTGGHYAVQWGLPTDTPVPADYDGDGKADPAIVRDGVWWVLKSTGGHFGVQWGLPSDQLVPADYDGDGKTDPAIFRDGVFWILKSDGSGYEARQWGFGTDRPVPADYDGDGKADAAIYRDGVWWVLQTSGGHWALAWGLPTDDLVPADYDGDGKADPAIYREGIWAIYGSTAGYFGTNWGATTDAPLPRR